MAARYGFSEAEMLSMPTGRLYYWYRGHMELHRGEMESLQQMTGGKRG